MEKPTRYTIARLVVVRNRVPAFSFCNIKTKLFGVGDISDYFNKIHITQASHKKNTFNIGDEVRVLPSYPSFIEGIGKIIAFYSSNRKKGRIYAKVLLEDGRIDKHPLGRLRHKKKG